MADDPDPDTGREKDRCPSENLRGVRCTSQRGHGALHSAEVDGLLFIWSDQSSPALALDLLRHD